MSGESALDASVTLGEVFTVLAARRVPLAPELAGYLVLEIAEHADPSGGDVDPRTVFVGEEGTVALVKPKREATTGNAEASVRHMLARLLEASGSQTPALSAASKRKSGSGLPALAEELETALIPVNRAAGRRALARLAREVRRVTLGVGRNALPAVGDAMPSSRRALHPVVGPTVNPHASVDVPHALPAPGSDADVDDLIDRFAVPTTSDRQHARALRAMVGLDETPGLPPTARPPETQPNGARSPAEAGAAPAGGVEPSASPEHRGPASQPKPHDSAGPATRRFEFKRGPGFLPLVALLALGAGTYAMWRLRPSAVGHGASNRALSSLSVQKSAPSLAPPCTGTLIVSNVPPNAEVLIGQGQAPVDVEKMPVGARLEFVATAEGYIPKRVVIPPGASWDSTPDGKPRFEAAVQLDRSTAKAGNDPWPAGEPGSEVGGQGPPGTVRVVATPRGAEIWMLAGIGPEARVDQLHCDRDIDVLIAGPTTFRKKLRVASSEFRPQENPSASPSKVAIAQISAK